MAECGCRDCLGLEPWPGGLEEGPGVHTGMSEALPVVNYGLTEEGRAGRQDQHYPPPCPGLELYSGHEFQRALYRELPHRASHLVPREPKFTDKLI